MFELPSTTAPWVRGAVVALIALILAGLVITIGPLIARILIAAIILVIGVWALFALVGLLRKP